jgi:hypothetical protein
VDRREKAEDTDDKMNDEDNDAFASSFQTFDAGPYSVSKTNSLQLI